MNIFEVKDGCPLKGKTEQMTEEELQREYDFHIAESIIANLYKEGKITVDELHKISALNRQKFSPRLAINVNLRMDKSVQLRFLTFMNFQFIFNAIRRP